MQWKIDNHELIFDPRDKNGKLFSNFLPLDVFQSQSRRVYGDEIPLPILFVLIEHTICRTEEKEMTLSFLDTDI
jgi:hypothetical protein